jgi:hypothetical protein
MRKALFVLASCLVLVLWSWPLCAAPSAEDYAVLASAAVEGAPARITLCWPQERSSGEASGCQYLVQRKLLDEEQWGREFVLPDGITRFVDTNVTVGVPYEYQIIKITPYYRAYGYIVAGIDVPVPENRGKLLLVTDLTVAEDLALELARLEQDLIGDGWTVVRLYVNRNDPVARVKRLIKEQYRADPVEVKCVFLFGHVPVPYSGNIVPDGHAPDHQGAWPCDGYYGDMDGRWTDHYVRVVCATESRNRNVPGDGKFDQSSFPARLKLMVGRVDLANMPGRLSLRGPPTFPSEVELLRNYLNKNHRFRMRDFEVPRRGVVGDYFGPRDGEAFAASGWRNFAAFFGASNITALPQERTWIENLSTNAYLWAYGCGPGTYTSIGGLGATAPFNDGVTTELVGRDIKAVFSILFGSWLGDWDAEDGMLRAVLATPSYGLTCAWSGRPHWFLQHMGLGEPIGFSARLTQNNGLDGLYRNQSNHGAGQIQIALMGDPSLRMHIVTPPSQVLAETNGPGVRLSWSSSADCVLGYHVYRARYPEGPYVRLTSLALESTSYLVREGSLEDSYMVRALKRERSGSGTYLNLSQGAFSSPVSAVKPLVVSADSRAGRQPDPAGRMNPSPNRPDTALPQPEGSPSSAGPTGPARPPSAP